MNRFALTIARAVLALGALVAPAAVPAQSPPALQADPAFAALEGRWVRPDGGYTIAIKSVSADGKLDAVYANPKPLPFAKAEATRDGKTIKVFLELRAGGYNGSTYSLNYDPVSDVLKGVYYQAVAQQQFAVVFARTK
ncbi:MAG: hypothetical protein ABI593_07120 [Betaproteobacteria bacterium]